MLGTLETTFHGQKTLRLVRGSLSWLETSYFHKGTLMNRAKVASEHRNVRKNVQNMPGLIGLISF